MFNNDLFNYYTFVQFQFKLEMYFIANGTIIYIFMRLFIIRFYWSYQHYPLKMSKLFLRSC